MEEKKSNDIQRGLLDNFAQHYVPVQVEYGTDDESGVGGARKQQFDTHSHVIYYDYQLKLWKRGEVITYVYPEYKVSWGGSWAWVHYKELHKDNGDGKVPELPPSQYGPKLVSNDSSQERAAVVKAVDWSHFTDFFSDYLLTNLWKRVDTNLDV